MKNLIGITMGDPKGIGPETIAKAWRALTPEERAQFRIYGDRKVLDAAAELAGTGFDPKQLVITSSSTDNVGALTDAEAGRTALAAINAAESDVREGRIAAMVTAPVNKHRLQSVQHAFLGHTEYLAQLAHVSNPVMMFVSEGTLTPHPQSAETRQLCISLVTTHLPLREVPRAVTRERILETIRRTHEALEGYFACPEPRIAVLSLNPHAGEAGSLGHEEKEIVEPAVRAAQKRGINDAGPLAADGLFARMHDFDFDAVVAMYHDQGVLPVKLLCQGKCTNITLGLPYIRTSPGHGTAEDIAWLGQADHENMLMTLRLTRRLVGWTVDDSDQTRRQKAKG